MTKQKSTKPQRNEINDLLDDLEDEGWYVLDYNPSVDPFDPLRVKIHVERRYHDVEIEPPGFVGRELADAKHVLRYLESDHEDGAPIDEAVDALVVELEIADGQADELIEDLRERGELYEPETGFLRTT